MGALGPVVRPKLLDSRSLPFIKTPTRPRGLRRPPPSRGRDIGTQLDRKQRASHRRPLPWRRCASQLPPTSRSASLRDPNRSPSGSFAASHRQPAERRCASATDILPGVAAPRCQPLFSGDGSGGECAAARAILVLPSWALFRSRLASLASFAANLFSNILDSLAFVGLGRSDAADLRGNLTNDFLVRALDHDRCRLRGAQLDSLRRFVFHGVREAKRELQSVRTLIRLVADADPLQVRSVSLRPAP